MSGTIRRLGAVPNEPPPIITADDFPDYAREQWQQAKMAYDDAFRGLSSLHFLMHRPGPVKVLGTVTAVRYDARRLREAADRMLVASDAIIAAAKRLNQWADELTDTDDGSKSDE